MRNYKLLFGLAYLLYCQAAFSQIDHWETIINLDQDWKYLPGNSEPPSNWKSIDFSDNSWSTGKCSIGFGDGDDATIIQSGISSLYIRTTFTISDITKIDYTALHIDYDDGFIAYMNGVEIARSDNMGLSGSFIPYNYAATPDHEAAMYSGGLPELFMPQYSQIMSILHTGTNVLAIQINNYSQNSSDLTIIPFFSVGINTTDFTYQQPPSWFWVEEPFISSNLPLILINTNEVEIQDEPKISAQMGIIDNGTGERNYFSDSCNNFYGRIGIEIRGSSSSLFPQLSYGIELWDSNAVDTSFSLLGMPAESDWILYAPYTDKSLLRNNIIYDIGNKMNHWAPRTRFCELFINGKYQGIYVLLEKIKRGEDRVDIANLRPQDTTGFQLTGGYILKVDRRDEDEAYWVSPYRGIKIVLAHPKLTELHPKQLEYIESKITAFEDVINGSNYKDPENGYRHWVDLSSLVDYIIVTELTNNIDAFSLSTFFYKDRDDKDSTIHFGPIWDYNLGFGNADYGQGWRTDMWRYEYEEAGQGIPKWWAQFMSDPYFTNLLKCRWVELRKSFLNTDTLMNFIDEQATILNEAQVRHFKKWQILGTYVWPNYFVGDTYESELNFLKTWIIQRLIWLDQNFPENYIKVSTEELSIGSSPGSQVTFSVESNTFWQISTSDDWLSVESIEGSGISTVTLSAYGNPELIQRTGYIYITSISIPGLKLQIKVNQYPGNVGLNDISSENINVFPNPVCNILFFSGLQPDSKVIVYDSFGRIVFQENISENHIDVSSFSEGLYIVKITNKTYSLVKKIIVNRQKSN